MPKVCEICGKKPSTGNNVSHAHNRSKRRWTPNLQRVKIAEGKTARRANVCAKCIKAGKVVKSA